MSKRKAVEDTNIPKKKRSRRYQNDDLYVIGDEDWENVFMNNVLTDDFVKEKKKTTAYCWRYISPITGCTGDGDVLDSDDPYYLFDLDTTSASFTGHVSVTPIFLCCEACYTKHLEECDSMLKSGKWPYLFLYRVHCGGRVERLLN